MKVRDLMTTNVTCINEHTSMAQIAAHMKKDDIGSLPVCDDKGHIKGIVTDRDLVLRALARMNGGAAADEEKPESGGASENENSPASGGRGLKATASDIMTTNPVTVSPNMDIHEAALLFSAYKIRRLPVTEASKLVGMLSLGDMAARPVYVDEAGDALSAISLTGGANVSNVSSASDAAGVSGGHSSLQAKN